MSEGCRIITALDPDRRISGNLVVELDGARVASLPTDVVAKLGLRRGDQLDDVGHDRLIEAAENESAYHVSVRILSAMPRAINDLKLRLRQRGHGKMAVDHAVSRLEEQGLLDDEEFGKHFARMRFSRGHGASRILTDLLSRGVDRRLAESVINEVLLGEEIDLDAKARELAEKRASQLGDVSPAVKKRRLLAYLGRRGFRGYEITEMVNELVVEG